MTTTETAPATRKSRKSGAAVTPQKSTSAAWFATFLEWTPERQSIAIDALEALRSAKIRKPVAVPQDALIGDQQ